MKIQPMEPLSPEEMRKVFDKAEKAANRTLQRMLRDEERNRRASRLMLGNSPVFC